MMNDFFNNNMIIMRVLYTVLFFLYAFAIVLKQNRRSELKLARSFWLLAVYGFSFGINELITIILMVKEETMSPDVQGALRQADMLLRVFAFMVIFWLGIRLIREVYPRFHILYWTGLGMSLLWTVMFLFTAMFRYEPYTLAVLDNLARYMFAAPGLFLSGYGLLKHVREVEQFRVPMLVKNIRGLAYTFFWGTFIVGLVASHPVLWPGAILNRESFGQLVGVPLVFFRSVYLVLTTYFVVRIVNVFEVEREHRLEEALKSQVLAEERDRIARELHDGIIQSIYGVGLKLKQFKILCEKKPADAVRQLDMVQGDLDNIIVDIRDYITELHLDDYSCVSLREAMEKLAEEFRKHAMMAMDFTVQGRQGGDLNIVQVNHILQIVRELLSNAAKHSRGTRVTLNLKFRENELTIRLGDDGQGFDPDQLEVGEDSRKAQGLNNIFHRVSMLQGEIVFHSAPGQGTHYEITFPYSKLSYLQSAVKDAGHFSE
jgi:signal transduction histidine kinase